MSNAPFGHGTMFLFGRDTRVEILRRVPTPGPGRGWPGHRGTYVRVQNAAGRAARVPLACIRLDAGAQPAVNAIVVP